ncbi:MAG: hypothetical protein AAF081_05810 [Actinomycetota bacterium]
MAIRRLTPVLAGTLLLAAACGGGDDTDDSLTEEESLAIAAYVDSELSLDEQRCILEGIRVLEIGPEQITTGDLTAEEDGELLAVVADCLQDPASFEPFVDSFIAGAAEGGTDLTREEARCAIRALEVEGDDAAILACLSDETIGSIEDPTIDLLSDQCRRGNNQACDELFRSAPEGSDASIYAMTCGNRLPSGTGLTCFDELG